MNGAEEILLLISSTLFLCYLSGLIYTKTKIPDILWLLAFGILLGPIFGVIDKTTFQSASSMMGVIAICIITFDSGINLDVKVLQKTFYKSSVLTLATFFAMTFTVGYTVSFLMPTHFTIYEGLLLGTMVAGISTVAVSTLLDGLQKLIPNLESTRALLMLESTLCDPIRVVAAITIIRFIFTPTISLRDSAKDIVFTFVMGTIIGLVIGLIWGEVLDKLRGQSLNYMMTLAILFPTYIVGELVGDGGGTMAVFLFGLVLANYKNIAKWLGVNRKPRPDKAQLQEFNEEMAFFLKSYYFVYIGLIVEISQEFMLVGLGIVVLIMGVRYVIGTSVSKVMGFTLEEKTLSRIIFTLGTSTIVMSQIPAIYDPTMEIITNQAIYTNLCFPIVLGTVVYASVVSPILAKRQLDEKR